MKRRKLTDFIKPLSESTPTFNGTNKNCPKCGGHDLIREMPPNKIHVLTSCRSCGYSVTTLMKETIEPPRDETPDLTTPELDKLAGDEKPVLPELRTGDVLKNRLGYLYRVYRVNSPKTGMWIEARYRLEKIDKIKIKGHSEFSLDELQEYGMELYNEHS